MEELKSALSRARQEHATAQALHRSKQLRWSFNMLRRAEERLDAAERQLAVRRELAKIHGR